MLVASLAGQAYAQFPSHDVELSQEVQGQATLPCIFATRCPRLACSPGAVHPSLGSNNCSWRTR
jgi:hypothetical protein